MAKRIDRTLVFRAEFQNRIVGLGMSHSRILFGKFVVEIRQLRDSKSWGAMVNGDAGDMIAAGRTAAEVKERTRRQFEKPVCDWVVGRKTDGQWRPLEDVALGVQGVK